MKMLQQNYDQVSIATIHNKAKVNFKGAKHKTSNTFSIHRNILFFQKQLAIIHTDIFQIAHKPNFLNSG